MNNPGNAKAEEAAWNAVLPAVEQLKVFYDFANDLRTPSLLFCRVLSV
jgi:hypothetical protein